MSNIIRNVKVICVMFGTCSALLAANGKIAGRVLDKETNEPLPGVNILVEGTAMGAATDLNGEYVIINVPPGDYTLRASYIGYTPQRVQGLRVSIDQTTRNNFILDVEVIEGEEVVVIAERPMVQRDLTASQKVTTSEEINVMPVETFIDVLTTQAGVNVGADGALHIRGGRSNEIGYYIDGISVSNPFFTNSLAIGISNQALEEMKVVSGAFNAEYGNAMSGIVNLQVKEGSKNYHGSFSTYTGDYISNDTKIFMNIDDVDMLARKVFEGTLNGPVPLLSRGGKFTFNISGRTAENEGYMYGIREHLPGDSANFEDPYHWYVELGGDSAIVPMNSGKSRNILGKLTYRVTPRLKFSTRVMHDYDFNRRYNSTTHPYKYNPDGTSRFENEDYNYSFNINHSISQKSFYEAHFFYSTTDYKEYQFQPIDLSDAIDIETINNDPDLLDKQNLLIAVEENAGKPTYIIWNTDYYVPSFTIQGSPSSATFEFGGTQRAHTYRQSKSQGLKFDITSQLTQRHEIKTGINIRQDNLEERNFEIIYPTYRGLPYIAPENESPTHSYYDRDVVFTSAYLQDKMEYQNFIMNAGIRLDYFDPNYDYITNLLKPDGEATIDTFIVVKEPAERRQMISPRLGVAFPITDEGILHFSYGHFYQMPTLRRLYKESVFGAAVSPTIGYANLKPEKTVLYEFGLQQQLTPVLAIEASVYYKDIRELLAVHSIRYDSEQYGPSSYSIYLNKDYGAIKGLTISLTKRYDPATRTSAFLDYSYQVTNGNSVKSGAFYFNALTGEEEEKNIVPLDWDQQHIINATVTISDPNNWGLSFIAKLSSGWPYTPTFPKYSSLQNITPDPNSAQKPWQKSVDVRLYKNFKISGFNYALFAKIYNLFDTRNERYVYDDTGRAGYTFINRTLQETEEFKRHYGEPGIKEWSEYQVRPYYYRAPRLVTIGFSVEF